MCHKKHRWIRGIVSQGGYPILTYRPKMLRIGGGGASLRMARQRMSFSSSSSFWSASSKFMRAARAAAGPEGTPAAGFFSSREMRGFSAAYEAALGWLWKAAVMGRAPASKCVMGFMPSRNSMVRSMEVVLYMLLSTAWRFTQGEITKAGERWESTWSGPFWASSSRMKIAVLAQNRDLETPSTSWPTA